MQLLIVNADVINLLKNFFSPKCSAPLEKLIYKFAIIFYYFLYKPKQMQTRNLELMWFKPLYFLHTMIPQHFSNLNHFFCRPLNQVVRRTRQAVDDLMNIERKLANGNGLPYKREDAISRHLEGKIMKKGFFVNLTIIPRFK